MARRSLVMFYREKAGLRRALAPWPAGAWRPGGERRRAAAGILPFAGNASGRARASPARAAVELRCPADVSGRYRALSAAIVRLNRRGRWRNWSARHLPQAQLMESQG